MKKYIRILIICLLPLCLLCGCGPKDNKDKDKSALAAEWELVSFTTNGKTDYPENFSAANRKLLPQFECKDGVNCIFVLNEKEHKGTISEEDGKYVITYDDTDQTMTATLSGDTLTITNNRGTLDFTFTKKPE